MSIENTMLCNLPADLVYRKIETLHKAITDLLGFEPKSFRAGRWGFNHIVANAIHRIGYRVDSSVTPLVDWTAHHGPDFSKAPLRSYRIDMGNIVSKAADGELLEVPPSIGFLQRDFKRCREIRQLLLRKPLSSFHLLGILNRLDILSRRWLSPELSSASEMIRLSERLLESGFEYLNMSFHSTSLLPGKSPFVQNDHDLEEFLYRIETFLKFAVDRAMAFSGLSGALDDSL